MLACASTGVQALQVNGNIDLDATYTDNAALAATNETDDIITAGRISGSVSENQGRLTGNATASYRYVDYLDNTYDAQQYSRLAAAVRWNQISNVLVWTFNDYFIPSSINSLGGDTPDNTEDINVARLGAQLTLRPADRHIITIAPSYADYYYEISGYDNQQSGIDTGWSYSIRPTLSMTLNGGYRKVDYDSDLQSPDYDSKTLTVGLNKQFSRGSYRVSVGSTSVSRDSGADSNGLVSQLAANYKLSSRSTLIANASSNLTDTSNIYLTSSIDPDTGNFANVQVSNDVIRNSLMRVTYSRSGSTVNFTAWTELRKLDYSSTDNDRKIQEYGATLSYLLLPGMTASFKGQYVETEEKNPVSTDKYYLADGQLKYNLSRKMHAHTGVSYKNRDNTDPAGGYTEVSVFAGLGYRLGR